jgi:hypothetical protein
MSFTSRSSVGKLLPLGLASIVGQNWGKGKAYSYPFTFTEYVPVPRRGYAEVTNKFSRAKPHMNIGTIGE